MRLTQAWESRRSAIGAYAVLAPIVVGVGAAAPGIRWAGWGASVSSALWSDWFHTAPHGTLAITTAEDVQAAALLLLVGVAVTELAPWGQRGHADAAESADRLEALVATARSVADHRESELIVREVEEQLTALLDLDRATWIPSAPAAGAAVLPCCGVTGSSSRRGPHAPEAA